MPIEVNLAALKTAIIGYATTAKNVHLIELATQSSRSGKLIKV
ncbi:MAG: hypothetical protein WBM99_04175 [Psychromonas sp.]